MRRHYDPFQASPSPLRPAIGFLLLVAILFGLGKWVLGYFGVGNTIHRYGVTLTVEDNGNTNVSIEGGDMKRAENDQKLYPGDRVATGAGGSAMLRFFDGTVVRMDELTDVSIEESHTGKKQSKVALMHSEGTIWLATPEKKDFSGAILRTVSTPFLEASLPSRTESVITGRSIVVFAADGIGATLKLPESAVPVIVGEGQKFTLPPNIAEGEDLYAYRSPLDPFALASQFVEESRALRSGGPVAAPPSVEPPGQSSAPAGEEEEALTVLSPENGITVVTATVPVRGTVGRNVTRVRVNGYNAPIDAKTRAFSQELALPDEDEVEIVLLALDDNETVLGENRRLVKRDRKPAETPAIVSPATNGQTYRTSSERFLIEGTAPQGTLGIIVNDYRLQLYQPGNAKWSYLASTAIDNLHPGRNVYNVVAINRGGYKSEPAVLTIILGEGPEGVVDEGPADVPSSSSAGAREPAPSSEPAPPAELPDNAPLKPGSLKVTGPTPGLQHSATGSSFLIEGTTAPETDSLWVNDYRLRLYEPGKVTWNYIADAELGTLQRGRNVYTVITRDDRGRVLDELQYVVDYRPGGE